MTINQELDIKICGLSTPASVEAAISNGASMIGFVFFEKSPRNISLDLAQNLAKFSRELNPAVKIVALTVNAGLERLRQINNAIAPDIMQLHGQETPDQLAEIKAQLDEIALMKAIGVTDSQDLDAIYEFADVADAILLDAKPPKGSPVPGGNGLLFDWNVLSFLQQHKLLGKPLLLSGGLKPDNAARAVQLCSTVPAITGLDLSSGVESSPGIKDPILIQRFLQLAQEAQKPNNTQKRVSA